MALRFAKLTLTVTTSAALLTLAVRGVFIRWFADDYWIAAATDVQVLRGAHGVDADSTFWAGLEAYESHDAARAGTSGMA